MRPIRILGPEPLLSRTRTRTTTRTRTRVSTRVKRGEGETVNLKRGRLADM